MARPKQFYVAWRDGKAIKITHGRKAALAYSPSIQGFKTKLEAEEFAMWWNHNNPQWWERQERGH